jgi:hypothetical protein
MPTIKARPVPTAEAVTYIGSNAGEVVSLVRRVAALHIWSPLEHPLGTVEVRTEEPHLGVSVNVRHSHWGFDQNNVWVEFVDETCVLRVEPGNVAVFDPFAETPLFVLTGDQFDALYEVTG